MRYRRLKVEGASYFFTVVTFERRKLFGEPEAVELLNEAIFRVRNRHPFDLEALVVLPDHLHALWQMPPNDASYSMRWRLVKEAFTRSYMRRFGIPDATPTQQGRGEQTVWQRRFWEHLIRDDSDFAAHLDYIHLNPVHHGLSRSPEDWPHSTFKQWVGRGAYEPGWGSDVKPALPDWSKKFEP